MKILDLIRKRKTQNGYPAYSTDQEIETEMIKIGRDNKKHIIKECQEKGIPIPNFKKEGINKR